MRVFVLGQLAAGTEVVLYYILDIHTLAITYVRISSWSAYVLLLLLVQSQWRTLRSAV